MGLWPFTLICVKSDTNVCLTYVSHHTLFNFTGQWEREKLLTRNQERTFLERMTFSVGVKISYDKQCLSMMPMGYAYLRICVHGCEIIKIVRITVLVVVWEMIKTMITNQCYLIFLNQNKWPHDTGDMCRKRLIFKSLCRTVGHRDIDDDNDRSFHTSTTRLLILWSFVRFQSYIISIYICLILHNFCVFYLNMSNIRLCFNSSAKFTLFTVLGIR